MNRKIIEQDCVMFQILVTKGYPRFNEYKLLGVNTNTENITLHLMSQIIYYIKRKY